MTMLLEGLLVLIVLTNLLMLGSSRLGVYIRAGALQGVGLAFLFFTGEGGWPEVSITVLALVTMVVKGGVFPMLLFRTIRQAGVRREVEPYVGFTASLLIGVAAWGFASWVGGRLPLPGVIRSDLLVPTAMFTIFTGLFLIVARRNAITQVLGYLVLENGVFTFGVALETSTSFLVEMGILLDIFVGVFVMVITLFQINREIEEIHMDSSKLSALKD